MDKQVIKSISEAYSIQPRTWYIRTKYIKSDILRIELGVDRSTDKPVYRGFDAKGNLLFMCIADAVNVEYLNQQ